MAQHYSTDEISEMAKEVMESLRPKHLTVGQIKRLAYALAEMTENIVLREVPENIVLREVPADE